MVPMIKVSEATWERLQKHAEPFVHAPEDIVNLALDALERKTAKTPTVTAHTPVRGRLTRSSNEKLPQREFRMPLVETISELGGGAPTSEIKVIMREKMASRLLQADFQKVSTGDPRWWNAICWERNDLKKEGYLKSDSAHGVWELTEKGRALAGQYRDNN
jgi:hypothetical protein